MPSQEYFDLVERNLRAIAGLLDLVQTYADARAQAGEAAIEVHRAYGELPRLSGLDRVNAKDELDGVNERLAQAYARTEGVDPNAQIPPQIFGPLRTAIESAFIAAYHVKALAFGLQAANIEAWRLTLEDAKNAAAGAAELPGKIIAPVASALTPLVVVLAVLLVVVFLGRKRGLI